jgi:hypothetical protein
VSSVALSATGCIVSRVASHMVGCSGVRNKDDDEDEQIAQPVYTASDALKAAQVLIEYTESQESLSTEYLRVLEHLESGIEGIQQASLVQRTIDSWIM